MNNVIKKDNLISNICVFILIILLLCFIANYIVKNIREKEENELKKYKINLPIKGNGKNMNNCPNGCQRSRYLNKNYRENFKNISFSGPIWEDRYDGHIPRKKTEDRLMIEDAVGSSSLIKQLDKDYNDFINENATQIKL